MTYPLKGITGDYPLGGIDGSQAADYAENRITPAYAEKGIIPPYIIDDGMAGTWRAALHPNNRCAGCGQTVCPCPDAVWSGLVPACPSCGGLNTACPDGCGRDPLTGELNGTCLDNPPSKEAERPIPVLSRLISISHDNPTSPKGQQEDV